MAAGDVLVVADEELAGIDAPDVAKAGAIIVIGTTLPAWARHASAVVLPIANFAEEEGTFTNLRGRVQRFLQARTAPGFARPSWYVLSDLLTAVGVRSGYSLASEVFAALAASRPEFAGLNYDILGARGRALAGEMAGAGAQSGGGVPA
jgi:predicted molibdopterin-dependent oxidoreductase YjgC